MQIFTCLITVMGCRASKLPSMLWLCITYVYNLIMHVCSLSQEPDLAFLLPEY